MNIHLPAILMFTRGTKVLTHCQMLVLWKLMSNAVNVPGAPWAFSGTPPRRWEFPGFDTPVSGQLYKTDKFASDIGK